MFKIIGADQKEYGPISTEQIRQWIRDGRLNAQTAALREGTADWQTLSAFAEFADLFQAAATPGTSPAYAPSAAPIAPGAVPTGSREAALSAIKGPAIALIIVASLAIVYYIFIGLFAFLGHHRPTPPNLPPQWRSFYEASQGPMGAFLQLFFAVVYIFVLFGAIKMMKLQSHTLALITCIVALLPFGCCCIFALPFGIWGLVMLNKPAVKSQFS